MSTSSLPPNAPAPRAFWILNALGSIVALAGLAYLVLLRSVPRGNDSLTFMPAVNATFNAATATFLILAVRAIRRKDVRRHRALVLCAFASSAFFFAGYLAYHFVHGDTPYPGTGFARTAYLTMLASHIVLSVPVIPLCVTALYFALTGRYRAHRRVARVLFPVWLYVSVTGVLVFFALRSAYGG